MGESSNRKCRQLQIAYTIFLAGMAGTTLLFVAMYALGQLTPDA